MNIISQWVDMAQKNCVLVDLDGLGTAVLMNFDHVPTAGEVQAQADVLLAAQAAVAAQVQDETDAATLAAGLNVLTADVQWSDAMPISFQVQGSNVVVTVTTTIPVAVLADTTTPGHHKPKDTATVRKALKVALQAVLAQV